MPYKIVDEDDFECENFVCINNEDYYCQADDNVENLTPGLYEDCISFRMGNNIEAIVYSEGDIKDFMAAVGDDTHYEELDPESERVVLKCIIFNLKGERVERTTVFRVDKKDESDYYYFAHVNGGVGAIHKSLNEADFSKELYA